MYVRTGAHRVSTLWRYDQGVMHCVCHIMIYYSIFVNHCYNVEDISDCQCDSLLMGIAVSQFSTYLQ